jgi:hypothetical protein
MADAEVEEINLEKEIKILINHLVMDQIEIFALYAMFNFFC